jgi:hypothetical protein
LDPPFLRVYVILIVQFFATFLSLYLFQDAGRPLGDPLRVGLNLLDLALALSVFVASRGVDVSTLRRVGEIDLVLTSVISLVNLALYGNPSAQGIANSLELLAVITLAFAIGFLHALSKVFT